MQWEAEMLRVEPKEGGKQVFLLWDKPRQE